MSLKYIVFHWFIHFLLAFFLILLFNLNLFYSFLVFLSTLLIDLDHLTIVLKKGLKEITKFTKPKKYFLHNFLFLIIFTFLSFSSVYFFLKVIFFSFILHLLWDLFEDVLIFKMGIKHWLIKRNN